MLGSELGRGGQGSVWDVRNVRWTTAPEEADVERLVFKRYRPASLGKVDPELLESMPRFWERLSELDRARLLRWVAWPLETVGADGVLSGFLMPQISSAFFFERRLLSGDVKREMATMQFLLNDAPYLHRAGIDVNSLERLAVLKDLAQALAFLHQRDIVIGDISPMNVFWSTAPKCRAFLIDADSMMIAGKSATGHPVATPDWAAPISERGETADIEQTSDDVYKLGLMVLRVLTGSQTERAPGALDAKLSSVRPLVEASLAIDPGARPTAAEWAGTLSQAAAAGPRLPWLEDPPPRPKRRSSGGGASPRGRRHKSKKASLHDKRKLAHRNHKASTQASRSATPSGGGTRSRPHQVRPQRKNKSVVGSGRFTRRVLISLLIVLVTLIAAFGITFLMRDTLICTTVIDESVETESATRSDFIGKLYNCTE